MSELLRSIIAAKAVSDGERFVAICQQILETTNDLDSTEQTMLKAIRTLADHERKLRRAEVKP